ncbi:MAG: energy transducer TonB [Desulfobacterales bacterium]
MKKRVSHAAPERFAAIDVGSRKLFLYFGISMLLHIILMGVFVVMPSLTPSRRFIPSAVNVSLVSLPAPPGSAAAPQKPVVAAPVPEPAPVQPEPVAPAPVKPPPPPPKPAAEVSTAPTPKPEPKKKEPVKPKAPQPAEVIKNAVSKMEKEVAKPRQPSLQDTIDRLRQQVAKENRTPEAAAGAGSGQPGSAAGSRYGTGLTASQFQGRVQVYQAEIASLVQKNWAYSELMSGGRPDLEALLGFTIRPNGEISDIWFDQKSGNVHLDESAYRAIAKSSPLPPLPAGLFEGGYTVGMRFGPKGIK